LFTDTQAFGASAPMLGASVVYYNVNPMVSADTGSPVYGQLKTWNTRMTQPVALSTGFATAYSEAGDGTFIIWFDSSAATTTGTGNVSMARTADCKNAACAVITLATGVQLSSIGFGISEDHRYAAYATSTGSGAATVYSVQLVDVDKGTQTTIASGAVSPGFALSPDGSLLAVGMGKTLSVFKTADGSTVPWGTLPITVTRVFQTAFVDSTTLYLRVTDNGGTAIYKAPAVGGATLLSPSGTKVAAFQLQHNAQTVGAPRYLFATTTLMNGVGDLQVYDLEASAPQPTQIGAEVSLASVQVSNTQSLVHFVDNYIYTSSRGTLTVLDLPATGMPRAKVPNIFSSNVSGVPLDEVTFLDTYTANGTLEVYKDGNVLPIANGVVNERIRLTPSPLLYFSVTTPDTLLGLQPGIYAVPLP
jgi:hypothetical protein